MKIEDVREKQDVLYVAMHAQGDKDHPDCERGMVSSKNERFAFVKFYLHLNRFGWDGTTAQDCNPRELQPG